MNELWFICTSITIPITSLLAILIPGALVIGLPILIASRMSTKPTKDDGYTAGWVDGFFMGQDD